MNIAVGKVGPEGVDHGNEASVLQVLLLFTQCRLLAGFADHLDGPQTVTQLVGEIIPKLILGDWALWTGLVGPCAADEGLLRIVPDIASKNGKALALTPVTASHDFACAPEILEGLEDKLHAVVEEAGPGYALR